MHNLTVDINSLTELIKSVVSLVSEIYLISAIISSSMPQGAGKHKKSNQGFASTKYDREKKRAAQSRGGRAKVPKGFARMSPEERKAVARKGGLH